MILFWQYEGKFSAYSLHNFGIFHFPGALFLKNIRAPMIYSQQFNANCL
jgi:hypothetical protein